MIRDDASLAPDVGPATPRAFGITFAVICAVVALFPLLYGESPRLWVGACAILMLTMARARRALLAKPNRLWLGFGARLHVVMSLLILGVLFYGVLTPFALILRAFGRDRLHLKRSAGPSYWSARDDVDRAPSFDKPY